MRTLLVILSSAIVLTATPIASARRVEAPRVPPAFVATVQEIPDQVRERMVGTSWRPGCPVGLERLRLVRLSYRGFDRDVHTGRLVVHRSYAWRIVRTFRTLFEERFPIRRMRLVDAYGGEDRRSMAADNTSAFNCRYRGGVCCTWSMHAYGKALDLNPVENPYVGPWGVAPPAGRPYVDRSPLRRGMIAHGAVWRAFDSIGWEWGGDWGYPVDYQHFSANGR